MYYGTVYKLRAQVYLVGLLLHAVRVRKQIAVDVNSRGNEDSKSDDETGSG